MKNVIIGFLLMLVVVMTAVIALLYQFCVLGFKDALRRMAIIELAVKAIDLGLQKLNTGFKADYLNAKVSEFSPEPSNDVLNQSRPPQGGLKH